MVGLNIRVESMVLLNKFDPINDVAALYHELFVSIRMGLVSLKNEINR